MTSAAMRPSEQIFRTRLSYVQRTTNQVFFWPLLAQWALAIVLSLTVSPYAWEGRERTLHIVDVGGGVTAAPLVCEDLARLDEVADLVRRIGPSLVVAVLLDGPQLPTRWSCRYASILADDPGAAVLTLTSFGMASLSRPSGKARSRVVAHWNDGARGVHAIELAPRATAILLSTDVESRTSWTADGRRHSDVPGLRLTAVQQLFTPRSAAVGRARVPAQGARDFGSDA